MTWKRRGLWKGVGDLEKRETVEGGRVTWKRKGLWKGGVTWKRRGGDCGRGWVTWKRERLWKGEGDLEKKGTVEGGNLEKSEEGGGEYKQRTMEGGKSKGGYGQVRGVKLLRFQSRQGDPQPPPPPTPTSITHSHPTLPPPPQATVF